MAVSSILGKFGGRKTPGHLADGPIGSEDFQARLDLLDDFEDLGISWLWATDSTNRLIYLSRSAAGVLDKPIEDLLGKPLASLFEVERTDDAGASQRPLNFLLSAHSKMADLAVRISGQSEEVWWSISGRPQLDTNGDFKGYRGNAKDVTRALKAKREAERLAEYDSLTGLANRHRMTKRLDTTLTAYQASRRSCALMMLDLDRFKQVNDTLGHPAGDDLLRQVAQRLERIVGKRGEIGRLGGDEFQIMLPDMDDRGKLGEIAARIIQMISQPYSVEGGRANIGTSVGMAIAPYDGLTTEELVKSADLALYAAKGGGRGQYRFYSTDLKDSAQERQEIEGELREALAKDQLELFYQPVVEAGTGRIASCEALMRWNHPERGPVSPAVFIPIAEESNLIVQIGDWAIRQACAEAKAWPASLRVAVNVSAHQFANGKLASVVTSALANSELDPERLELEITESVFMGDKDALETTLKQLKQLGVRLALDDFGTGYSSLSYLRKAPFDKIKIDQSFVRGCTERGNNNAAIIKTVIDLAGALGMETTAEGVEAQDELDLLRKQGASYIQGYIYSRPVNNEEFLQLASRDSLILTPQGPAHHRSDRITLYRKIGVIHEDHYYRAVLRNLSKANASVDGILGVPVGTNLVLDLSGGQLAVCRVVSAQEASMVVEFETPLISDGADGYCTRHRVSPYSLAAAGMPLAALPPGSYPLAGMERGPKSRPAFIEVEVKLRSEH